MSYKVFVLNCFIQHKDCVIPQLTDEYFVIMFLFHNNLLELVVVTSELLLDLGKKKEAIIEDNY